MASSTTKRKKKAPPKKKRKPASKRPTLVPSLIFLLLTAGLIGALYLIAGKHLPKQTPAARQKTQTVTQPDSYSKHQKQIKKQINRRQKPSNTTPPATQTIELVIYRLSSDFSQLVKLPITANKNLTDKRKAQRIISLLTLPSEQNQAPLDRATKLRSVSFNAPLITIDLSADIRKTLINSGGNDEIMTIACLVNSLLKNFPEFNSVQILIDGKKYRTLAGHIDISRPLSYQTGITQ